VSFLASAWIAVFLTIGAYAFGFIPEDLLTNFDRYFVHARPTKSDEWTKTFQGAVKRFGDQQIVTGIAILGAGFTNFRRLSVFQWHLLVYLAWMSSSVHLTSLTFIRDDLLDNPNARFWRVVGMSILLVLLLIALVPTSRWAFQAALIQSYGMPRCRLSQLPATCFWQRTAVIDTIQGYWIVPLVTRDSLLSYLYLVLVFLWKISAIFRPTRDFVTLWCRERPITYLEIKLQTLSSRAHVIRPTTTVQRRSKWLFHTLMAFYFPVYALTELSVSFAGSLLLICTGLSWGTIQVLKYREGLPADIRRSDNRWGFGQILPLLLLAL